MARPRSDAFLTAPLRLYCVAWTTTVDTTLTRGAKQRNAEGHALAILLANVQSLENKLDDLRARVTFQRDVRDCNILCFTETWLTPTVPDRVVTPSDSFLVFRMDRMAESNKTKGGGVCFMVNRKWCDARSVSTVSSGCSPHLEHLSIKCCPFYLPREFSSVITTVVYIPPDADTGIALTELHYVLSETLDHCYTPYKQGYKAVSQPAFGKSDHSAIFLIPQYKQHIPRKEVATREVKRWSAQSEAMLQDHSKTANDVNEFTDVAVSFVSMLAEEIIPTVRIRTSIRVWRLPSLDIIAEKDVRAALKRVNSRKAAGPDGINGRLLDCCADQLAGVLTYIFNESLAKSVVPKCFKRSIIVPITKNNKPSCLNDYRPVALTSEVMKVFERLMKNIITSFIPNTTDPLHFAYQPNRSTEDAISHVLHTTLSHVDMKQGNYVRLLCVSDRITTNIGAPQGCVLSPLLYSLYTSDCVATHSSNNIVKFADDTVVLGFITNNDESAYMDEVKNLASWWQDNHLQLNVRKTKELVVDFRRRQQRSHEPLIISGAPVEKVSSFKYLGVHISSDLTWTVHIQVQSKKARQRLSHLRQLRKFRVSPVILRTFYSGAAESILTQNITSWHGNSCVQDRKALQKVIRAAECCC
ncbi:hypothetical protein M9458_057779, partial [Cirrhinus mrigala]